MVYGMHLGTTMDCEVSQATETDCSRKEILSSSVTFCLSIVQVI